MNSKGNWFIIISLLVAMILTLFPMPDSWQVWRPSWLFLLLTFWIISIPHRIGMMWSFICGISLDGLLGTTLGVHVFVFAILTFLVQLLHKRIRLFPLWKQALTISGLSFIYVILLYWLGRITANPELSLQWQAIITNGLIWPWLYILLRNGIRYFRVQ